MATNILDPLGLAQAARNQINAVATKVKLPSLPNVPQMNGMPTPAKMLRQGQTIINRPGYTRDRV